MAETQSDLQRHFPYAYPRPGRLVLEIFQKREIDGPVKHLFHERALIGDEMMDGQGSKQRRIDYNHVMSKKHESNNGSIKSSHDSDFI